VVQPAPHCTQICPLIPPNTLPQPQNQPSRQNPPPAGKRIVEVSSDRQEYDEQRQIVTAEGNVLLRFDGAVLMPTGYK